MKLSLKLRPTGEGRSSEIFRLFPPPPQSTTIFSGRCFPEGEDGDPNKEKNPDDPSDNHSGDGGSEDTDDQQPLDGAAPPSAPSSPPSSRSSTPAPLLLPPPPPPPPPEDEQPMPKDISSSPPSSSSLRPELMLPPPVDEDEDEEDMASSVATEEDAPLDFSVKRGVTDDESTDDEQPPQRSATPNGLLSQDGPLDLTVPRRVKSSSRHKHVKLEASLPSSPWGYSAPKHLPKAPKSSEVPMWNGKVKSEKRDKSCSSSSKLNRSSSQVYQNNPLLQKNASPPLNSVKVGKGSKGAPADPYRPAGRQNPWQSQWMSRSSEQTRDVFTCVWCKESFRSLEDMTVHMKQSPRCGMAGMQTTLPPVNHQSHPPPTLPPAPKGPAPSSSASASANPAVIKENVSLPRKLVRGQDVWLGKGAEQTRQILKCMWCGQSFKTLADMTTHMRVTQHYTNIISQEQIISWRTPEDKMAAQSQVNAVLTCKVCDQAFGSLKELSYHMVKNSHYKEHILRSITEGGGRRRQTRERRKKSLPVRKLLELERMELNKSGSPASSNDVVSGQAKNEVVDGKISCEECTEKVDAKDFVQHIKNCAQGSRSQQSIKSSPGSEKSDANLDVPTTSGGAGAPTSSSPLTSRGTPEEKTSGGHILNQDDNNSICDSVESTGSTSVLNALEKLIEKSFEPKGRRNAVSTGILQRLGIDEEVYPPWHPSSSPSGAFGVLRGVGDVQRKSTSPLGRLHEYKMDMADFSGSESRSRSSSTSEKHPSFDEHLRLTFGLSAKDVAMNRVSTPSSASQASCSPVHFRPETPVDEKGFHQQKEAVAMTNSRSATPGSDKNTPPPPTTPAKDDDRVRTPVKTEPPDEDDPPPTPKSIEDRQTPVSRSSSCEPPEAAPSPAPPELTPAATSPAPKPARANPRKRKNSEVHRKSPASSSKRRPSSSHRRKSADRDSTVGSPMSDVSASPRGGGKGGGDAGDHPLKELQKLLDKTDAHLSRPNLPAAPGSILAFSWACSEATTSDSLMKCAFCDTHFISKGAYRHHLSKMHFVKDGSLAEIAAASTWKPPPAAPAAPSSKGGGGSSNGCRSSDPGLPASPQKDPTPPAPVDESPHSKFLKYTELAKQLSSKYV